MAAGLSATPGRRRTCLLGAWLGTATAVVAGQQPAPQPQQPLFRAGVDLVTIDVRAVDKDSKPVPGLTKSDFVVTLDGQVQPVVALDYQVFGGTRSVSQPTAPTDSASNPPASAATASRGGRVLLLVVDDLSAQPLQMKSLLISAENMLATLDESDMVGIVTTSGLGPAMSPTRDRAAILAALRGKGLVGRADARPSQPYVTVNEAFDIARPGGDPDTLARVTGRECGGGDPLSRGRGAARPDETCPSRVVANAKMLASLAEQTTADQVAAYLHAVTAMRSAPVPRTVIALTGGVAVPQGRADTLDRVSEAAADADVGFYGLVAIDDMDLGIDTSAARAKARRDEGTFMVGGMESLALTAGGEAHRVVGQADRFYNRIVTETSGLYRLGVEAPTGLKPDRYVSVKVSVKRPGVTVHANAHALQPSAEAAAPATPAAVGDALKLRIEQGGAAFGVPIQLSTGVRRDTASARLQMLVNVDVPADTPGPLATMFAVMNRAGTIVFSGRTDVPVSTNDDYRVFVPVPLDDGDYRLRVAVADAKGNIGSVDEPVAVHLQKVGPFMASDLLTTFVAADGVQHYLGLGTLPANATTVRASLELYADTLPPEVTVRVSVASSDAAPLFDEVLTPAMSEGRLSTSADIPVASLPVGRDIVTATVSAGGHVVGAVSATVRKGP
jgi:VWFA-related protein